MKKIFILILVMFFIFNLKTYAETVIELRQRINETNNQIEVLDKEIKQYQSQISKTSEEAKTLANLIKELTLTRSKLIKEKTQTEKKILATGFIIEELSINIDQQQNSIDNSKESLSMMIKELNRQDQEILIEKVLSKNSLSDISREYNNIISINKNIQLYIKNLKTQKEALTISKNKEEEEQEKLESLKQNLTLKQKAVESTKSEKDKILSETKNKENEYKKLLDERQKLRENFEKQLTDYESQLKFILNPSLLPKEGSGVLSWPLENILITSFYGSRGAGFHYGVDFRASIGTVVKAMTSGEVIGIGDTDIDCKGASFGKWIFIKYNNGLSSTYGHLSFISAKVGQKVKSGDVIGLSGNTGYSTGPHLHISVYASGGVNVDTVPSKSCNGKIFKQPIAATSAYLNPLLYLPKVTQDMIKK